MKIDENINQLDKELKSLGSIMQSQRESLDSLLVNQTLGDKVPEKDIAALEKQINRGERTYSALLKEIERKSEEKIKLTMEAENKAKIEAAYLIEKRKNNAIFEENRLAPIIADLVAQYVASVTERLEMVDIGKIIDVICKGMEFNSVYNKSYQKQKNKLSEMNHPKSELLIKPKIAGNSEVKNNNNLPAQAPVRLKKNVVFTPTGFDPLEDEFNKNPYYKVKKA